MVRVRAGKYYLSSLGEKVGPMEKSREGHFYVEHKAGTWHLDGSASTYYDKTYKLLGDLVEEYSEDIVTQGPIREVRRREIVPGQWGNINVNCVVDGNVFINVRDDFGHVAFNAEQLREAAHLFNQLAEFLDEEQP